MKLGKMIEVNLSAKKKEKKLEFCSPSTNKTLLSES
jgi:hypothetical protein